MRGSVRVSRSSSTTAGHRLSRGRAGGERLDGLGGARSPRACSMVLRNRKFPFVAVIRWLRRGRSVGLGRLPLGRLPLVRVLVESEASAQSATWRATICHVASHHLPDLPHRPWWRSAGEAPQPPTAWRQSFEAMRRSRGLARRRGSRMAEWRTDCAPSDCAPLTSGTAPCEELSRALGQWRSLCAAARQCGGASGAEPAGTA